MKAKRLIALLLAAVMVLGLAACGTKQDPTPEPTPRRVPESTGR